MNSMNKFVLILFSVAVSNTSSLAAGSPATPVPRSASLKIPLQYVVEKTRGSVLILPKGSNKPEKAREEQTLRGGDEIITQGGSEASLTLNENTLFHVGPDSRVTLDKLAKKGTRGFTSRLKLWKGKILAEVEKLKQSRSVFEVDSGGVLCGVRGTSFEVEVKDKTVEASTYHGTVYLTKNGRSQDVASDQHAGVVLDKGAFLPQRALTPEERRKYQDWLKEKAVVQQKQIERQAILNSMSELTPEQKEDLLDKLEKIPDQDRLRSMRQLLQDRYKENRRKMLENASRSRSEALRKNQEDAASQRQKLQENAAKLREKNSQLREKK